MNIAGILEYLLQATAQKTTAEAQIKALREVLEVEANRRLEVEGAAPSWKAAGLGTARLDGMGEPKAYVKDADSFSEWVRDNHPTEVEATITVPGEKLDEALELLRGIGGIQADGKTQTRPGFVNALLPKLKHEEVRATEIR